MGKRAKINGPNYVPSVPDAMKTAWWWGDVMKFDA